MQHFKTAIKKHQDACHTAILQARVDEVVRLRGLTKQLTDALVCALPLSRMHVPRLLETRDCCVVLYFCRSS
jgi:hypothetical protein